MLFLLMSISDTRYAMPVQDIVEVIPNILPPQKNLQAVPHFSGHIDYHGQKLPVLDLCQLMSKSPCQMKLSTRIVLITIERSDGSNTLLGLLAEKITETLKVKDKQNIKGKLRFICCGNRRSLPHRYKLAI